MIPPSGRQVELGFGDQRAIVTEVGGGLRRYDIGTWAVVDGYGRDEMASAGRGQLLMPWPNRMGDGRYRFAGVEQQLPLDETEHRNAIHGLVRWAQWTVAQQSPSSAVATHCLHPRPGYPFHLELRVNYDLTADGLTMAVHATNVGAEPAPFGAGWHPYVSVGTTTVDAAILHLPARATVPTDNRGLPCGDPVPIAGTGFDFREPHPIGDTVLDTCYTELERDAEGVVRVRLSGPDGRPRVDVWGDAAVKYVMAFTGDTVGERRRRGLALEPMTCPPDAFRSGIGLIVIAPGETSTATWGIRPTEGDMP